MRPDRPSPLARALRRLLRRSSRAGEAAAAGAAATGVDFGDLRRLEPFSRVYGFDRGLPIDRHFIEAFLRRFASDIRGRVLEVGDDGYTRAFGGAAVSKSDVLHAHADNPRLTLVGNLEDGSGIPVGAFDCVILTQTLQFLYDLGGAVQTIERMLAPGGVALATVPGISQLSVDEWRDSWYWSFTERSARRLFEECFEPQRVRVEAHGNVLASVAFLEGLATAELDAGELAHRDPLYPMLITIRAEKARL